jgi:endonuclease/exonuclease/phosphatase family metal-dependent hydrolase
MKVCFAILIFTVINSVNIIAQKHFGVMSYNCENAFDTIHDVGKDDYDFLPEGERNWTRGKFYSKLRSLAHVILAADSIQPVDIVGLCEVENDSVMSYLTNRTFLKHIGYEYVITNSNDNRGLDVALMYIPYTFKLLETQTIRLNSYEQTRDVLRATGRLLTGDTVDVFVVHLPSKLGGRNSDLARINIVLKLKDCVDSLLTVRGNPNFIIMGDFNANHNSKLLKKNLNVEHYNSKTHALTSDRLYSLLDYSPQKFGTYKYKGVWSIIDNIIVSGSLLDNENSLYATPDEWRIIENDFLLEKDKSDMTYKPKRSFLGNLYRNGYSDHLPVYCKFKYSFKP